VKNFTYRQQQQYIIVETIITMTQKGITVPRIIPNKALLDVPFSLNNYKYLSCVMTHSIKASLNYFLFIFTVI